MFSLGWFYTAVANAVGTVLGCLVLIILMEERGMDFIKESFPVSWRPPVKVNRFNTGLTTKTLPQAICLGVGAHPKWIKWPQFDLKVSSFFWKSQKSSFGKALVHSQFLIVSGQKCPSGTIWYDVCYFKLLCRPCLSCRPLSRASGGLGLKAWCNLMAQLRRYLCLRLGPSWDSFKHAVFFKVFG